MLCRNTCATTKKEAGTKSMLTLVLPTQKPIRKITLQGFSGEVGKMDNGRALWNVQSNNSLN